MLRGKARLTFHFFAVSHADVTRGWGGFWGSQVYAGLSYTSRSVLLARITQQDYTTGATNVYPFNEITIRAVTSSGATSTDSWSVTWTYE